jgi:hypothetical protein
MIEIRYLASVEEKKSAHKRIAGYFSKQDHTERRRDEEPWQWQQAEEKDILLRALATIKTSGRKYMDKTLSYFELEVTRNNPHASPPPLPGVCQGEHFGIS